MNSNRCVCCGELIPEGQELIPEGQLICPQCIAKAEGNEDKNLFMLGSSGSGKSFAAKRGIEWLLSTKQDIHVYVLDAFGEYQSLTTNMQGQVFNVSNDRFSASSYISDNRFVCYDLEHISLENETSVYISLLALIQTLTDKPSFVFVEGIDTLFQSPNVFRDFCSIITNPEKQNFHYVGISMDSDPLANCEERGLIEDSF